jgi:ACT domain-containing protein
LAEHNVNVVDIRQTIIQEFFTMIMVADVSGCTVDLHTLQEKLDRRGADLGVQIKVQHEKVFQYMHRI